MLWGCGALTCDLIQFFQGHLSLFPLLLTRWTWQTAGDKCVGGTHFCTYKTYHLSYLSIYTVGVAVYRVLLCHYFYRSKIISILEIVLICICSNLENCIWNSTWSLSQPLGIGVTDLYHRWIVLHLLKRSLQTPHSSLHCNLSHLYLYITSLFCVMFSLSFGIPRGLLMLQSPLKWTLIHILPHIFLKLSLNTFH